jgi:ABC-type nitrate/sulfonate/bicarbonate transport system substrate-binding protein
MNEFFVQPEIRSFAELKGKTVIVDAPNTAYALQAKKILRMNGLQDSDYTLKPVGGTMFRYKAMREDKTNAASMLNPPFSVDAAASGLKSMGRAVDIIGPYQATGAFVMRKWAAANADTLERYIAAQIEATRWARSPTNKDAAAKMLAERFKLQPEVAAKTLDMLHDPKFGLSNDARFDMEGFKSVLALRAEIEGSWGGKAPAPDKYVDLAYYERAKHRVGH